MLKRTVLRKLFYHFFLNTWQDAENLSEPTISGKEKSGTDSRLIIILAYSPIAIILTKYFGHTTDFLGSVTVNPGRFDFWFCSFFFGSEEGSFHSMLYWAGCIILFYLLIPMLIVKAVFRQKLSDYGFRFRNDHRDFPFFLIMLIVMLPLVWLASSSDSFLERYPLYQPSKNHLFPSFLYWQMAYFVQFVAVEFFFRGFMLHGSKQRFGFYSVFVMTIPYCLVHIGKPFPETLAAIPAGIILGTLSLRNRSITLGIMIHYIIAISMDIFALWREGYFDPFQ